MTDIPLSPAPAARRLDAASVAAKTRLRARYRKEARFQAYGIASIIFAVVFLVVLLGDILLRALPAFTIHEFSSPVELSKEALDPEGTGNLASIMQGGDFDAPVRAALRAAFPEITGRAERRAVLKVFSQTGAGDRLRALVRSNPERIGQTLPVRAILDPNVDLYLKGVTTDVSTIKGSGTATPTGVSGEVTLSSTADDFKPMLDRVAEVARGEALRIERDIGLTQQLLEKAGPDEKAPLETRIAEAQARLKLLQSGNGSNGGSAALSDALPTLLIAINGGVIKVQDITARDIKGTALFPLEKADAASAGTWSIREITVPASLRKITDDQIVYAEKLKERGFVERYFNWPFFTGIDSAQPETAGLLSGLVGSALMLLVTLLVCLPVGVGAAIYLEEFAPKNALTHLIEININNLAAVPSIIFGLLGMAVFIGIFGLGRGTLVVGGLVLALLVLPTIIIAARAALKAVPPSIREAALGIGASRQQAVFQHVLPLAMPGIMTGTIIGMAHALGETAPLLMIGMLASAPDVPTSIMSVGSALPSTIYNWSDQAEAGFQSKTAAAIIVLLMFLFVMNGLAIWLRKRFERKW
jgi:phosphate transport system permease protein